GVDSSVVTTKEARNRAVAPFFKNANLASKTQSLAVANFSAGKYKLVVTSKRNSIGAFSVNLFLAGDVNGDRQVNANDAKTVKKSLGKRTRQAGYSITADANLSGVIDSFDLTQATANNKDRTTLNPLPLSAAPLPAIG